MIRDLIARLGGPATVAAFCGEELNGNAVTAWGLRNQIPWKWRASVKAMAAEKQIDLSEKEEAALSSIASRKISEVA